MSVVFSKVVRCGGVKSFTRMTSLRSFHSSRSTRDGKDEKLTASETPLTRSTNDTNKISAEKDISSINYFHEKGIIQTPIQKALLGLGFTKFTPVQTKSIEPILSTDKDLIVKAKTGTGKTLAFGIPLIKHALNKPTKLRGVVSLIIAPTRDLAFQIRDEINKVLRHREVVEHHKNSIEIQTLVGGENRWQQMKAFERHPIPSIVVATPGRFLDLIQEPRIRECFTQLDTLVLDEADRLLGDGFKEDLVEISDILKDLKSGEKKIKTLLYSATLDKSIVQFSQQILRKDVLHIDTVDPNEPETHEKIKQSLVLTNNFFESVVSAVLFIENESKTNKHFKAIVFLPTIKAVSYFYDILNQHLREKKIQLHSHQLHGQLSQPVRDRSVRNFRNGFSGVLVASDVGARGMDFPNVSNVIQIGLPMDSTNYVHRVGRTARGGNTGKAVMILSKAESRFVRVLKNRNVTIADQFEYEPIEHFETRISDVSMRARHKYSLDLVIESLAGFTKGVLGSYRLNLFEILTELSESYGRFYNEPEKKPRVSMNFANQVLGLKKRDAEELFDLGPKVYDEQGTSQYKRRSTGDHSKPRSDSDINDRETKNFTRGYSPRARNFETERPRRNMQFQNDGPRKNFGYRNDGDERKPRRKFESRTDRDEYRPKRTSNNSRGSKRIFD